MHDGANTQRLVLGTAQLGSDYGIANKTGQPNSEKAQEIITTAWKNEVREFDTAQAYGSSEEILGRILWDLRLNEKAKSITKLSPSLNCLDRKEMERAIQGSLKRLHCGRLYCLMLHKEHQLDHWDEGLAEIMEDIADRGLVKYVGVSVYTPSRALQAVRTQGIDCVQLPANILDRRCARTGVFALAAQLKKKVYVRSIYLQGLLLFGADNIPKHMEHVRPIINFIHSLAGDHGMSIQQFALAYVKKAYPAAKIVFGAETASQVLDNCHTHPDNAIDVAVIDKELERKFPNIGEKILNPGKWGTP